MNNGLNRRYQLGLDCEAAKQFQKFLCILMNESNSAWIFYKSNSIYECNEYGTYGNSYFIKDEIYNT